MEGINYMKLRMCVLVMVCVCFLGCERQKTQVVQVWRPLATPEELNGTWEGSDTVLLPKGKFTLPVNTSGIVTAAVKFDIETDTLVSAIKYDYSDLFGDLEKLPEGGGKTKQELWNNYLKQWGDKQDGVITEDFAITTYSPLDVGNFVGTWEPEINQTGDKMRVLLDLTDMYKTGRGTYIVLDKINTSKLLSAR
jgi:hypothetical protein